MHRRNPEAGGISPKRRTTELTCTMARTTSVAGRSIILEWGRLAPATRVRVQAGSEMWRLWPTTTVIYPIDDALRLCVGCHHQKFGCTLRGPPKPRLGGSVFPISLLISAGKVPCSLLRIMHISSTERLVEEYSRRTQPLSCGSGETWGK